MTAGRELDALVADGVMGIVWDESRCRMCGWLVAQTQEQGCTKDLCAFVEPPATRADEPAHYSTDIAAAWKVVDRMRELGFGCKIDVEPKAHDMKPAVEFYDYSSDSMDDYKDGHAWDEAVPCAICRAALQALGIKTK